MRRLPALVLLIALSAAAAVQAAEPAAVAVERGRAIVVRNCGMCHAVGRKDQSPNPQAPPFRELSRRFALDDLSESLVEGIVTGHPAMPEFRFSPAEVKDIIAYLRALQTNRSAEAAAAPRG